MENYESDFSIETKENKTHTLKNPGDWRKLVEVDLNIEENYLKILGEEFDINENANVDYIDELAYDSQKHLIQKLPKVITKDECRIEGELLSSDFSKETIDVNTNSYKEIMHLQAILNQIITYGYHESLVNSLHCQKSVEFYNHILKCGPKVNELLTFGYVPIVKKEIGSFL